MRYNIKPLVLEHVNSYLQSTFSPDGALLAIKGRTSDTSAREEADYFSHVFVWNTQTGDLYAHFQDYAVAHVLFALRGKTLATVHSNCVHLRDPATGDVRQTLLEDLQPNYTAGFWSLAFSPDGSRLAVGMETIDSLTSAYVVDIGKGSRVIPLSIHDETVKDEEDSDRDNHSILRCQFLPDSRLMLGTGYVYDSEDCVYLWDVQTEKKGTYILAAHG